MLGSLVLVHQQNPMSECQGIAQPVYFHVSLSLLVCQILPTLSTNMKRLGGREGTAMRRYKAETKPQIEKKKKKVRL